MSTSEPSSENPSTTFTLDPRLAADSALVTDLTLSQLRLMNDERYPWLILIPRRGGMRELLDLEPLDRQTLYQEIERISAVLLKNPKTEKLNIGALGNVVSQLHIHVIARHSGDAAWPGPVWGQGTPLPYADPDRAVQAVRATMEAQQPSSSAISKR